MYNSMVKSSTMDSSTRKVVHPFFEYYVFASRTEEPTEEEVGNGIYLLNRADSEHLRQFFAPLYKSVGVGITTSDDEVISGETKLVALAEAVAEAIQDAEGRLEEWPIVTGYKLEPFQRDPGEAIVRKASRSRLLEFLKGVATIVEHARAIKGYVHFGGGE
jgi:hypothetical protein